MAHGQLISVEEDGKRTENILMIASGSIGRGKGGQPVERQLEEIWQRLERAERELQLLRSRSRRLRWLAAMGVVGAIAFVMTQPTARQVQAEQSLRGRNGTQIRGPLMVMDDAGRPLLQVGTHLLGRGMLLFDAAGKVVCGIGITDQGRGVAVYDAQEKLIAGLGEGRSTDGVATGRGLTIFDPAQKIIGTLGMGQNGANQGRGVSVNDESGTQVVGLGVWPQQPDRGQLVISDRKNTVLFAQPTLP
jgi:hypothetical protein